MELVFRYANYEICSGSVSVRAIEIGHDPAD